MVFQFTGEANASFYSNPIKVYMEENTSQENHSHEEEAGYWGYSLFTDNMAFSNETHLLTKALIEAKKEMGNVIEYDSKNPHYKNRFASLEATLLKINPALNKHGLMLSQWPSGDKLISRIEHISGQWMMSAYDITAIKKDPQQMGSAITYARRYCAQAIAGICGGEEDDDGNAATLDNYSPSIAVGGPKQKPEDIYQEFIESVSEVDYAKALSDNWDELMRRTNKLADRKKLAALLNGHLNKGANSGVDDL